jgi:ubiquinone/menaquinone biosynthesis C-methylase UbiE
MSTSGNYPLERRDGEIERLHIQAAALASDCAAMLERIGVKPGWVCLDLGCGPGGITALLGGCVGKTGRVVGFDADAVFLEHARERAAANVEFMAGNAYDTGLTGGAFDLVHMRFIGSTAGKPEALVREAMRLARPGGVVAMQEPDMATLTCHPPHLAWEALRSAMVGAFASVDADINLARRLYALMRHAGLQDVQYRPFLLGVRSSDPWVDYLPSTVESLRHTIIARKLMSEAELTTALAECRMHLRDPDVVFTTYTVAQVWGRTV